MSKFPCIDEPGRIMKQYAAAINKHMKRILTRICQRVWETGTFLA